MITRKLFLEHIAILGAGAALSPVFSSSKPFTKIGIQLYTLHKQCVEDIKNVIFQVAKCGYQDVETYDFSAAKKSFSGFNAKTFSSILKDNGLTTSSGHYDFKQLLTTGKLDDLNVYIEAAATVGQTHIVLPYLEPELRVTSDNYKAIAAKLNEASVLCNRAGITLLYHNHDFEFDTLPDGLTGYEILLKRTDPSFKFEMDLYWVVRGGQNPIDLFKKHPGRFPLWHVKEMSKNDPKVETEIGKGCIDFKSIFANAKLAGAKHFFIEQENNYVPDPFGSVKSSAEYTKRNLM